MGRPRRQSGNRSLKKTGPGSRRRSAGGGRSKGTTITQVGPVGNISGSRPTVQATVKAGETTLSKSDIYVSLDGEGVGDFQYRRTTGSLSFTPRKLSPGAHTVEVQVSADGGKNARKNWSFVVG